MDSERDLLVILILWVAIDCWRFWG